MKYEVRYYSKSGNTKKLADAIANELKIKAETLEKEVNKDTDILFLGSAIYGFTLPEEIFNYLSVLETNAKVAIFSTSAFSKRAAKEIKKLLAIREIAYFEEEFYCKGEFKFMNKGKPDENDINLARAFANRIRSDKK